MSLRLLPISAAGFGLALLAFASSAAAHIRLLEPAARYEITGFDTGIKSCPCGLGSSNRSCNLATDASDPDGRSENVLRVEAGSQLTLRFDEYVDHTGSFRVAFDPDGADMADFNANILVPIVADPANTGGQVWEIPVTLPNMTCDNCTLQLIQAMHGDTTTPVADPASLSTYYTCVDLEIVAPGTLGDPPATDDGEDDEEPAEPPSTDGDGSGTANGGAGGSAGSGNLGTVPPTGDNTGGSAPLPSGSSTGAANSSTNTGVGSLNPATGAPSAPSASSSESSDSGGCTLGVAGAEGRWAAALGLAGMLTVLARRRRNRSA